MAEIVCTGCTDQVKNDCLKTSSSNEGCPTDTYGIGTAKGKKMSTCSVYSSQLGITGGQCTRCINTRGPSCFDTTEIDDAVDKYCLVRPNTTQLPNSDCLCVSDNLDPVLRAIKNNNIGNIQIQNLLEQKITWYLPCAVPNYLITSKLLSPPTRDSKEILCGVLNMETNRLLNNGIITRAQLNDFNSRTSCSSGITPPSGGGGGEGGNRRLDPINQRQRTYTEIYIITAVVIVVVGFILYFILRSNSNQSK